MNIAPNRSILVCAFANTIHGVERTSGQIRWTAQPFGDSEQGTEVELAVSEHIVIAVTKANIAFLDYTSGQSLVAMGLPEGVESRPTMVIDGPHVYVARACWVACYTLRGQLLWNTKIKSDDLSSMALGVPGNVRQADDPGSR